MMIAEETKTIFDEHIDFFYSYRTAVFENDDSSEEAWNEYWKNYKETNTIRKQFEEKLLNDELIPVARKALDDMGIVYAFQHYLKDKETKKLYVIETWDYVSDIRMFKNYLLRKKQRQVKEND